MAKLRVYELARELNIESKLMVTRLLQLGIEVASHQSTLSNVQAEQARKAIASGAGATAEPVVDKKESKAAPVVIRRRRRVGGDSGSESQDASPEEQAPAEETAPFTSVDPSIEVAAASAVEAAPIQESPVHAENELIEQSEPSTESAAVEVTSEPEIHETVSREEILQINRRPKVDSGSSATVVRRADPEEQQSYRSRETRGGRFNERRPPPPQEPASSGGARREDSRGTRIVGTGAGPVGERVTAIHSETHEEANRAWNRRVVTKEKERGPGEDEEAFKARIAKSAKKSKSSVNVRSLLDQYEIEGDVDDPLEVRNKRTVFTPEASLRKKDIKRRKDLKKTEITTPKATKRIVEMGSTITVAELAKQLSVKAPDVIKKLMNMGMMVTINASVDQDTATLISGEYNYEIKNNEVTLKDIIRPDSVAKSELSQFPRPAIVTVMGHVDHGKTSILDAIRKTDVISGEAGGITQHIGAYSVVHNGQAITFIDTPGHEAFSSMRARGANLTDIVILVVAADDGVMPQTVEAISHARAANVPIIVAVNKIDKPTTNIDRLYSQLSEHGIQSEEWGGEHQFVKVSALVGTGLPELLDAILLQSEVLELHAPSEGLADAAVVEAHVDKGRGPVATVIVRRGTLRRGDTVVVGSAVGRIRAMTNHLGESLESAGPSTPVEIIGLNDVPMAGDNLSVVPDEKTAAKAAEWNIEKLRREQSGKSSAQSLQDLLDRVQSEGQMEVPIIVKADTQGSLEAIIEAIHKVKSDKIRNRVIHQGVGGVTESDVTLAKTAGAFVIGFNVRANARLEDEAERSGVILKYFNIIYDIIDVVRSIMTGRLPKIQNEVIVGHAEVRDAIRIPKIGVVAGSSVTDGKISRASKARLIRDDVVIYEGRVGSLRRFKDDVSEVVQGYECGISLDGYQDVRIGDVIEAFVIEEHDATL